MIAIPRSLCRDVLVVVRKLGRGRATAGLSVEFLAGRSGLAIQAATPDVAVRHHTPGRRPECRLVVPLATFIKSVERGEDPVLVRSDRPEQSVPKGRMRSGPEVRRSTMPGKETFPLLPARFTPCGSGLLAALDAASAVTAKDDSSRFVLNRIHLRGGRGAVVATDSRQLLFQSGFQFPGPATCSSRVPTSSRRWLRRPRPCRWRERPHMSGSPRDPGRSHWPSTFEASFPTWIHCSTASSGPPVNLSSIPPTRRGSFANCRTCRVGMRSTSPSRSTSPAAESWRRGNGMPTPSRSRSPSPACRASQCDSRATGPSCLWH